MASAADALGDNPEAVVLHGRAAADAAEEALLDAAPELDDSDARRRLHVA